MSTKHSVYCHLDRGSWTGFSVAFSNTQLHIYNYEEFVVKAIIPIETHSHEGDVLVL